jgi:hypothetical protein
MRNFGQAIVPYRGVLLRPFCSLIAVTCFSSCLIVPSKASTLSSPKNEPANLPWSSLACDVAPKLIVLGFVVATLFFLARYVFLYVTSRSSHAQRTLAWGQDAPALFWLPSSLLLGGVVGLFLGGVAALLAPAFRGLDKASLQSHLPSAAIFALVGSLLVAALIQFAFETYFGWRPHRGELTQQPYKYKVDDIFHRIGTTAGIVLTVFGFIAAVALAIASVEHREISAWQSLSILIYVSVLSVAAGIAVYWFVMLIGWLLKGDILISLLIIIFVLLYWLNQVWRFLTGWIGSRSISTESGETRSLGSGLANLHLMENVTVEEADRRQKYREHKFLWLPVFFTIFGMIFLVKWPPIGAVVLVAAAISMLYYLVYYQNFIWLPVLFVIIGFILLLVWPPGGTVMLAMAAISLLYSLTPRMAL